MDAPDLRSYAPLALAGVGLAFVAFGGAHPSPWLWNPPTWSPAPLSWPAQSQPVTSAPPITLPSPTPASTWQIWLLRALGLALALVILFFVTRWLVRLVRALGKANIRPTPPVDQVGTRLGSPVTLRPDEVGDAVAQALRLLDAAPTPTDAVIAAWLAMERAAASRGVARHPAQTPTEFTTALLVGSAAPADDVQALRRLYWRARFSHLTTTPEDVATARRALTNIARSLIGVEP